MEKLAYNFCDLGGGGFNGKFGTNPRKNYLEKSVVSFSDANREFTYAPILTGLGVYLREEIDILVGFRMRFLIPSHVTVRHSKNVSIKYF
ncbi:hypothetical protein [Grimontia sp. NTOU-MAR1]|uniref:hypothetical protein n=1 Tax=Grimontia sp. NTOU-MAR1 TaxID=3111011 RepID=UPI002DB55BC8|nr:hypothetical protein [Grimontia sp. NTOU-MAR1]WRV98368.1 hypothetical protein VP504_02725 [Grimontia sp. NTOU-MAR1]